MNSTIKCIIFDFGNVFVKWDIHALYNRFLPSPEAVDSFLQEINFHEWNARQDAGRPFSEGVAELSARFPQHGDLIQAYDTYWEDSVAELIPGSVEILYKLKSHGWPLYLLSNFSAEKFPLMLEKYHFLKLFNQIFISGEIHLVKPNPAIFHYTLNQIQYSANECLFIDDSLPNIDAARTLGFHVIHFQSPGQLDRELKCLQI